MAGTELGSAFISVGLGTNSLAGEIKKAFGSAESSGSEAGKSAGRGFGGAFGIAAAAVGALGIGSFFKSAVSGAADLEQSVGAIDTVFKGSAGQMHEWAQSAASDVGLSANEFNELGTLIGSQLKNGGTAMDELAPKTQSLITLGSDLSSMFGGSTTEAVEALSSALKGERDPIERYGVSLNQAKIDAEAAALGFSKVGGSLSAEANQAATLSLIMKQTADAHGNFGRETDTLAHKQQVLNAQWANGKARIGTELLPVVAALTGALSSALGPAINGTVTAIKTLVGGAQGLYDVLVKGDFTSAFAQAFKVEEDSPIVDFLFKVRDALSNVGPMFASLSSTWGPLVPQVMALVSSFSPLSLIFQAIQPILPQIAGLFQVLALTLGTVLTGALQQLTPLMQTLVGVVSGVLVSIMPVINAMFIVFMDALVALVPVVMSLLAAIMPLVVSLASQLAPIITSLVTSILPPLMSIFGNIVNAIAPLITQISGLLIPIIQALIPVVVTVFSVMASVITSVMQIIQGVIQVVTGIISGNWENVWTGIQNIFSGIWNTIVAVVSGALQIIGQVVISGIGMVMAFIGGALANIGQFFADTWNNVVNGVSNMIGNVMGFFNGLPGQIMGAMSGIGTWLLDSGRALIQGFIDGISGMVGAIGDAVGGVLEKAREFFPFSPAKRGPFSGRGYTTYSGAALAGDFADSIAAQRSRVEAAASLVTGAAVLSGSMVPAGASSAGGSATSAASSTASTQAPIERIVLDVGGEQVFARIVRKGERKLVRA